MHSWNGNLLGALFPFEHLDNQKEAVSLAQIVRASEERILGQVQ